MLAPFKRLVFEYKFIVMKMCCLVQSLNKLAQNKNCFIYDFVAVVKLIQVDFYNLYVDLECHFSHD
jgi:ABC-type iron transport system FetAB permease component